MYSEKSSSDDLHIKQIILNVAKEIIVCIRLIHRKSEGSSHGIRYIKQS